MDYTEITEKIKHWMWVRAIPNSQELGFFQRTQIVTKILTKLTPGIECITC